MDSGSGVRNQTSEVYIPAKETTGPIYSPSHVVELGSYDALPNILRDPNFDPRTSSFSIGSLDPAVLRSLSDAEFGRVQLEFLRSGLDYNVKATAGGPFVLVLSESFDDRWVAMTNGQVITNHFVVNGYANGWLLEHGGTYNITISYVANNQYEMVLAASFVSGLVLVCAFGVIEGIRARRARRSFRLSNKRNAGLPPLP